MPHSILIVDDNLVIRRTLRSCLEQTGEWKVCGEAVDGLEGIEKVQDLRPDLVILDLSMPVMNGLDAARELKRFDASLPLLLFTSFKTASLEREAFSAGFAAVISKSELQLLFASIRGLLDRQD